MALSSYLLLPDTLAKEAHPANVATAFFQAHGSFDTVVPQPLGEQARETLRALGYDVDWRSYSMPHTVCAQEIADVRDWLLRALPPRP
jgi:phospholipase/carboxylesterase